jgi:hypothetical protein
MIVSIAAVAMLIALAPPAARADRIEFMDGTHMDGIIKKVETGQVTFEMNGQIRMYPLSDISSLIFDSTELPAATSRFTREHFMTGMEAQDIVGHMQDVEKSAADLRALLDEVKVAWTPRKTIERPEVAEWEATREQFRMALSRYQESLNEIYFHVLGKVDEYNRLAKEGSELYVGVRGVFSTGSPLVAKEMKELPLTRYVPANWHDTIFYEGYWSGYNDARYGYDQRID